MKAQSPDLNAELLSCNSFSSGMLTKDRLYQRKQRNVRFLVFSCSGKIWYLLSFPYNERGNKSLHINAHKAVRNLL